MGDFLPFAFVILIFATVIIAFFLQRRHERRRTETFTELAESLGLIFYPQGDAKLQGLVSRFDLFKQGRDRKHSNVLVGETDEVRLAIFDYSYTVGSGKNASTYRQTVAAIVSPQLAIPSFTMRPEGFFDSIGGFLGFQDIDFDHHPEFSSSFLLKSEEEQRVREFFDIPILDYFAKHRGISVEAFADQMIFYRNNKRVKPDDVKQLLADAYEVYGLLVDRQQRNEDPPPYHRS